MVSGFFVFCCVYHIVVFTTGSVAPALSGMTCVTLDDGHTILIFGGIGPNFKVFNTRVIPVLKQTGFNFFVTKNFF